MAKIVMDTELNTKEYDKQIIKLKSDIQRYMKVLESDAKIPVSLRMSKTEREELEATVERLKNQLKSLQDQAIKTGEVGEVEGERTGKGFEKGLNSLKRFSLGLLGIRGVFSLVRRATSTYLSQNETTANKLNAIWVALGNALAPIIELMANAVLKLVGYLNVFLRALGLDLDLTKNMNKNTKAVKKTSKAMKELNKEVYSFDEITKASKQTSLDEGGVGASEFNDFKMPELNEDIVKFLEDTAKFLKENWEWLVLIGSVIAGYKVSQWLGALKNLDGALGGLAEIGIVAVGVNFLYDAVTGRNLIEDVKTIAEWLPKINKFQKDNTNVVKNNNTQTQSWLKTQNTVLSSLEKGSDATNDYYYKLRDLVTGLTLNNIAMIKHTNKISGLGYVVNQVTGETKEYTDRLKDNNSTMSAVIQEMANMYTQGLLTSQQEEEFKGILKSVNAELVDGKVKFNDIDQSIWEASKKEENYNGILKATGEVSKTSFDKVKENAKSLMNNLANLKATPTIEFKANLDDLKSKIQQMAKSPVLNVGNILTNTLNKLNSIKLASGGIVYNPGRGVPIGSAIGGEATGGAEGVIPMNNDEVMETLGSKIAKHVRINLTNNVMLDSRTLARKTTEATNDLDFLTNGR